MSEPDFRVRPEALDRYAALIQQQREQLARIQSVLAGVEVPGGAFGHLPDSDELHEGYNEHATGEQQNLSDLMEVLDFAAEGLQDSAANYRETEDGIHTMVGGGR
ncbi:hypothetical protein [Kitasatospora terrestris]|uniref:PE domain-containing protein n=1 Tax=Kitasatospora terrestris TaxID=258051 RepID=A0ABP9DMC6_9ACTN